MISYIHAPFMVFCFFILLAIYRLWVCIDRLKFIREITHRAPSFFQGHLLAASLAVMPFLIAAVAWSGITLPHQDAPMNAHLAALMSAGCIVGCVLLLKNSMEYLSLSWAGSRVGAIRLVAMLRIIDAAGLAYALDFLQAHETEQHPQGISQIIDITDYEVRK